LHIEAVAPTPTPATEQRPSSQRAEPALEGVLDLGVEADGARELAVVVEVVCGRETRRGEARRGKVSRGRVRRAG
jgi:hypothetical protein